MIAAIATINTIGIRHRLNLLTVRMIPSQPVTDPRNWLPTDTQLGVKPSRARSAITTSTKCRIRVSPWKTRFSRVSRTLRRISVGLWTIRHLLRSNCRLAAQPFVNVVSFRISAEVLRSPCRDQLKSCCTSLAEGVPAKPPIFRKKASISPAGW